jgi:hypothetical protein
MQLANRSGSDLITPILPMLQTQCHDQRRKGIGWTSLQDEETAMHFIESHPNNPRAVISNIGSN